MASLLGEITIAQQSGGGVCGMLEEEETSDGCPCKLTLPRSRGSSRYFVDQAIKLDHEKQRHVQLGHGQAVTLFVIFGKVGQFPK